MNGETKKGNTIYIVIIILLVLALAGVIGYSLYDKKVKENETEEKEENKEQDEKKEIEFNSEAVNEQLNLYFSDFFYFGALETYNRFGQDLLANADLRGWLVDFIFSRVEKCERYTNGPIQSFPYVQRTVYEDKYFEVYGKTGLFEQDLANTNVFHTSEGDYEKYLGSKDYIMWNDTWGVGPTHLEIYADKLLYQTKENQYILSGHYEMKNDDDSLQKNGTFSLLYNQDENGQKHLAGLTIYS